MISNSTNTSNGAFFDPMTRQGVNIHLDPMYISKATRARLQKLIEDGGGRVTSNKEAASIWIVDPMGPSSLGEPPETVALLYAPWLIACIRHGSYLGPEQEDWCGFQVPAKERAIGRRVSGLAYPESTPSTSNPTSPLVRQPVSQPLQQMRPTTTPDANRWVNNASQYSQHYVYGPVQIWPADVSSAPSPPPLQELEPVNAGGKRTYNDKEQMWMVDVIQWCSEYPNMDYNHIPQVLARKGPHRTAGGYDSRLRRQFEWFSSRAPFLAECLRSFPDAVGSPEPVPAPLPRAPAKRPANDTWIEPAAEKNIKAPFTDTDWDDFIRYAAARPAGMDPIGKETAAEVWEAFAKKHPNHSKQSWRTWYQHRQHDLRPKIEEFRRALFLNTRFHFWV